jgi:hypothetical protein
MRIPSPRLDYLTSGRYRSWQAGSLAQPHLGLSSGYDATLSDSATLYLNLYSTICNHMMTLGQGHMRHIVVC